MPHSPEDNVSRTLHSNRVETLRTTLGISRSELATRLGCHNSQVFKLERGDVPMTLDWMHKIAEALDTSVCELLHEWDTRDHRLGMVERLWLAADEAERAEMLARIGQIDPNGASPAQLVGQEKSPLVEITVRPDGTYRAFVYGPGLAVYGPGVSPQETATIASPDKQKKKGK